MHGLFLARTYSWDLPLFQELGLTPFKDVPHNEEIFIGRYEGEDGSYVEISVVCWPAQFWRFTIHQTDTQKIYKMTTGSGSLSDFWPTVKLIMEDMINIKQEEE